MVGIGLGLGKLVSRWRVIGPGNPKDIQQICQGADWFLLRRTWGRDVDQDRTSGGRDCAGRVVFDRGGGDQAVCIQGEEEDAAGRKSFVELRKHATTLIIVT